MIVGIIAIVVLVSALFLMRWTGGGNVAGEAAGGSREREVGDDGEPVPPSSTPLNIGEYGYNKVEDTFKIKGASTLGHQALTFTHDNGVVFYLDEFGNPIGFSNDRGNTRYPIDELEDGFYKQRVEEIRHQSRVSKLSDNGRRVIGESSRIGSLSMNDDAYENEKIKLNTRIEVLEKTSNPSLIQKQELLHLRMLRDNAEKLRELRQQGYSAETVTRQEDLFLAELVVAEKKAGVESLQVATAQASKAVSDQRVAIQELENKIKDPKTNGADKTKFESELSDKQRDLPGLVSAEAAALAHQVQAVKEAKDAEKQQAIAQELAQVKRRDLSGQEVTANLISALSSGGWNAISNALGWNWNEQADKVDKWFAGTVLSESFWESEICYEAPQDLQTDGAAFIETASGTFQPVASIQAERVGGSIPLLCEINTDPETVEDEPFYCPGLPCEDNKACLVCGDDQFCHRRDEVGKINEAPAVGYLHKISWGVTAPSDEVLTPYLDENGVAIKFKITVNGRSLYADEMGNDFIVELKNGAHDGESFAVYTTKDYKGTDNICIEWVKAPHTKSTSLGLSGTEPLPDICNSIVEATQGEAGKEREGSDPTATVSGGHARRVMLE